MLVKDLRRGDLVTAVNAEKMNEVVTGIIPGMMGVVFETADFYDYGYGPMVRWFNGTCCNVYEGWVKPIDLFGQS